MATNDRRDSAANGALSAKQEAAALELAAGASTSQAARRVGAGQRTLETWGAQPAFRARIAELRDRMTSEAVGRLTSAMASAGDAC